MVAKTFVLGVGAQKAGTSWLHAYASAARGADMGFAKEYHVWDAIRTPLGVIHRVSLSPATLVSPARLRIALFQRWPGLYFRYFARLLRREGIHLTGDVTPTYCMLGPDEVRRIVTRFADLGIRTKIVFLMRDPVDRCWSAVRMLARHRHGVEDAAASLLADRYAHRQTEARTRYERVLATIDDSGIDPADVHVGIYEEMFGPPEIERLSEFLGVPADPAFAGQRVMAAPSRSEPPDDVARVVAAFYRATYAAVAERFPRARSLWRGYGLLGCEAGGGRGGFAPGAREP